MPQINVNPLSEYRRAQRLLRREFDAFNARHCPTCPNPCCVHPARITPLDIMLAEEAGWRSPVSHNDVQRVAAQVVDALVDGVDENVRPPCEYLSDKGCVFPSDLRPYGCTKYICSVMYERADRKTISRVKRLVHDLQRRHNDLQRFLKKDQKDIEHSDW